MRLPACLAFCIVAASFAPAHAQRSGGYSLQDVTPHASVDDCWIALDDGVYVITDYLPEHRGAPENLESWCGTDASEELEALGKDGRKARRAIEPYRIGELRRDAS